MVGHCFVPRALVVIPSAAARGIDLCSVLVSRHLGGFGFGCVLPALFVKPSGVEQRTQGGQLGSFVPCWPHDLAPRPAHSGCKDLWRQNGGGEAGDGVPLAGFPGVSCSRAC